MSDADGNGDGVAQVGERVSIQFEMRNDGEGPTADPFARLRNRVGKALDPVVATLEPGELVADPGVECASPKQRGCRRVLAPGETWTGSFVIDVKSDLAEDVPHEIELTVGDTEAYDHGSVVRSAFYAWFSQKESLAFHVGQPLPTSGWREPPLVEITRRPAIVASGRRVSVSGVVTDDVGVKHVMVFAGGDKAFFEGSGTEALRSLPFTADVELEPGLNVISVLATDVHGYVSSRSTVTWLDDPDLASLAE